MNKILIQIKNKFIEFYYGLYLFCKGLQKLIFRKTYKIGEILVYKGYIGQPAYWKEGEITKIVGIKINMKGILYRIDASEWFKNNLVAYMPKNTKTTSIVQNVTISIPVKIIIEPSFSVPISEFLINNFFEFPEHERRSRDRKIDNLLK